MSGLKREKKEIHTTDRRQLTNQATMDIENMIYEDSKPKWRVLDINELKNEDILSIDTLVINTSFHKDELIDYRILPEKKEILSNLENTQELIIESVKYLKTGGLLFIYGCPQYLSELGCWLNELSDDGNRFLFKYWIGLEFKASESKDSLPHSHLGLLMYLKTRSLTSPPPFFLNTKNVRIPYSTCPSCGKNIRDWGGKKHLLNPLGSAISDVWRDLVFCSEISQIIPEPCLERIYLLRQQPHSKMIVLMEKTRVTSESSFKINPEIMCENFTLLESQSSPLPSQDLILTADSLELMAEYSNRYPNGVFDLVFADPPYNLSKNYNKFADNMSPEEYINWCDKWLNLMCDVVKPGGALFVLNIPQWAMYHAKTLNKRMIFRNWIVWDALSTPSGKLLPAHYSLLYYTKPGGKPTQNYHQIMTIDSREYCVRQGCITHRKSIGENKTENVSDVWHDIFRIKHKKDRDAHPCQLPIKLLSRILTYASNPNDWVYDPFGGAGTTAIASKISNRHYIISDIDPAYKEIAENNVNNIILDKHGERTLARQSIHTTRQQVPKNRIEQEYYSVAVKLGYAPSLEELAKYDEVLTTHIRLYYPDYKYLKKITNRRLINKNIIN